MPERTGHRIGRAAERPGHGGCRARDLVTTGDGAAGHLAVRVRATADWREAPVSTRGDELRCLDGEDRVRAVAARRHEQVMQVLDGRLRVQRHDRVLELLGTNHLGQVAGHQQQRVADGDLAPPDLDPQCVVRGQSRLLRVVGDQQARRPHEVRLGAPDCRDIQLVVADDRDGDAQRAGWQAAALATAAQLAIGAPDRLLKTDGHARRLVVVILAPDRVRHERRGIPGAAADAGGADDEIQVPLGADLGAGRGFRDQHRVC